MKKLEELDLHRKKYIIFDLDGTLIDSIGMWNLTDYCLIKRFSGIEVPEEEVQNGRDEYLHNNTTGEIYIGYCDYLINKYGLSITDARQLSKIRRELYEEIYENEVTFKPDVVTLIEELKNHGYTVVLATMSSSKQIEVYSQSKKLIEKANIKQLFDLITTKETVTRKKPDPEIYNNIVEHYSASPDECLVFEDSYSGSLASKSANIETVNIYDRYSEKDRERINSIVDYSVVNYREFLDYLRKSFAESHKSKTGVLSLHKQLSGNNKK